jgi:hypothetical protein
LETRHVRNAFKIMPVKTDRKDARGIAELMRLGWFRPVGRDEESRGGAGPQTRRHHASDARRWHAVHDPANVAPCLAPSRTSCLAAVA